MHREAAHYYCEIADLAIKDNAFDKAEQATKYALGIDKQSVRASLLQAALDMKYARFTAAIRVLKRVPQQDPEFLTEIILPIISCYRALDMFDECIQFFEKIMASHPSASIIFVIAENIRRKKNLDEAIDFVSEQLSLYPSIKGLNRLISWHLGSAHGKVKNKLQMLYDITTKFLENKPIYRCSHCGFGGKHLHWHCPSCKQWGRVKPIYGLEGD
jgi:lipopolysaccharide biosynthesis regulator YciM